MGKNGESVRLRLVTDEDDDEKSRKKPYRGKNCCLCSVLQICCISIFTVFLVFIALGVVDIQKILKKKEKERPDCKSGSKGDNIIPGSDFCKSVNFDNMTLVALGYLNGIKEEKSSVDAKNQIYYITDRFFTDQESCAVEALLRLFQDKSVFVIEIGNFTHNSTNRTTVDYVSFLREQYTNLNLIKSMPPTFFRGSPFEKYIKGIDSLSIFAAKVLLVWQFGGTVLSPDFLLLTRRMFDNNEGFCEVDKELIFCPNQCSAYVYELVKIILDMLKSKESVERENVTESIVDKSVGDYCGDPGAVKIGCVGINRIKEYNICNLPNRNCDFLRVQEWKSRDIHWKKVVQKFCPRIVTRYMSEVLPNETSPVYIEK